MAKTRLIPAPLDEKNVTTDWIEELFDDQSALYGKNKMLGFMAGAAVQASWEGNVLTWKVLDGDGDAAIKKMRERYDGRYPDEESPFIIRRWTTYKYTCDARILTDYWMEFYWKPEE